MIADQAIRSEVYDAIQGVLQTHDLLVSPTLACMPVLNASDGDTKGPTHVDGVEVDPLIGWCLTYLTNFSGHPVDFRSRGSEQRPAGRHATHRTALRRRRRVGRGRGFRTAAAVGSPLRDLPEAANLAWTAALPVGARAERPQRERDLRGRSFPDRRAAR